MPALFYFSNVCHNDKIECEVFRLLKFDEMIQQAVAKFNNMGQKQQLLLNGNNKQQKLFIQLDLSLAQLAEDSKRFSVYKKDQENIDVKNYKEMITKDVANVMKYYLLFASVHNWLDVIVIDEEDYNKITSIDADRDFNQVYLSIKRMMFNGFYNHSKKDFQFSWKMFLKFGIVDLGVDDKSLSAQFSEINSL